ncbi:uncharacterized protein LOC123561152 [Mercenaria mercenaria]|uniref:uncharacterized protein LOC123561152 n=1 Tax=Mercenaria mercenaria TaxID=6596 RepID=UPI00234ED63E|nr:uncharacterized protein LOC123561152 [Mercenaria mercenaria]
MELKSVYSLIVIFIFNKISLLSGKGIKTGNFQVLHQHPGIKNCAAAVLYQNELVGGRVSNVTGMCEGLPYLWGLNETIQSGYAYVKKISAQESFQPPIILGPQQPQKSWLIPGVLSAGAKVEVTLGGEILA